MRIFHASQHVACYEDAKRTLTYLGHEVDGLCLSDHSWVLGYPKDHWRVDVQPGNIADPSFRQSFYREYAEEFEKYDAFLVTYPPCYSLLFAPWKKPIIMYAPIRYEFPWTQCAEQWNSFNLWIRMASGKQLTVLANNHYDSQWIQKNTGAPCEVISNLCEYPEIKYSRGKGGKILLHRRLPGHLTCGDDFIDIKAIGRHAYEDLLAYSAVVHIPYQVSLMSIFEQYMACIPMFVPTPQLLRKMYHDGVALQEVHWSKKQRANWEWVEKYADYYCGELPYIQQFNSVQHLKALIDKSDFMNISKNMATRNEARKKRVLDQWKKVLSNLF